MKLKKLWMPIMILVAALASMTAYCVVSGIAKAPVITKQSFPFSITYELNGKTETIEDVYEAVFVGNDGYVDKSQRVYLGTFAGRPEELKFNIYYTLSQNENERIILDTRMYADYMMGDTQYDYFEGDTFSPQLLYYDAQEVEYTDEQTLLEHGAKLVSWDYPEPVENSLEFSHIAPLNGDRVLPMSLIAALALLVTLIFVKKEKKLKTKKLDKISIICNIVVGVLAIPMTVFTSLLDIIGSSGAWGRQMLCLIPAVTLLGVAMSVALRRKGFRKGAVIVTWIGPALFAVLFVIVQFI